MPQEISITSNQLSSEQVELVKRTVARGATDDELQLFLYTAKRTGLDPLTRQIHAVKRWDASQGREVMAIQTGIDGYRAAAARTGELDGQEGPYWCGADGIWREIWNDPKPPVAAKVIVFRRGATHGFPGIAHWKAYAQLKKDGSLTSFWARMGAEQLAKCAEALALRKAFPQDLSGIYTEEEMQQVDVTTDQKRKKVEKVESVREYPEESPAPPASVIGRHLGELKAYLYNKEKLRSPAQMLARIEAITGRIYATLADISEDEAKEIYETILVTKNATKITPHKKVEATSKERVAEELDEFIPED